MFWMSKILSHLQLVQVQNITSKPSDRFIWYYISSAVLICFLGVKIKIRNLTSITLKARTLKSNLEKIGTL